MVDAALLSKWGDDDCGNAHANSPAVTAHGGYHMIPTAAVFVICDDDYTVLPNLALLHRGDEIRHVLLTCD